MEKTEINRDELVCLHEPQLLNSRVPPHFWCSVVRKLAESVFDAGNFFGIVKEDRDSRCGLKVVVTHEPGVKATDGNSIFLIDHAWMYEASKARQHLNVVDGLLNRMAALMNVEESVETVLDVMWKFNNSFSVSSYSDVEKCMPLWYIMDEFGSYIRHSDDPNCRLIPFLYIPEGASYCLLIPLRDLQCGEELLCDYVEGVTDSLLRKVLLIPWEDTPLSDIQSSHFVPDEKYFLEGRMSETLPVNRELNLEQKNLYNVYSEYSFVSKYLTHSKFKLVDCLEEADILWLTESFTDFEKLSLDFPNKYINQFPHEKVITVKDLLSVVCRNKACDASNHDFCDCIMPETYNLKMELPEFVKHFKDRTELGFNNHWICKPFNLARGLDCYVTDNMDAILRHSRTGPKIAQKYIHAPLLFSRPEIGRVKFDIRYVVLLKKVHPLEVYVYKNFFLRFANQEFSLDHCDVYEKHFTVMNYDENSELFNLKCHKFIEQFELQYPDLSWSEIEINIFKMIRGLFECATSREPPCGIAESIQSRAVYALDIMLLRNDSNQILPKLLEVNWTPDCQRACEFYPDFYNEIFLLLFDDVESENFLLL